MMQKLTEDFDGTGPIDVYYRSRNFQEAISIEEAIKYDEHGNVRNPSEIVLQTFLTLAKDSSGMRMFTDPADRDRVRTKFNRGLVAKAVVAFRAETEGGRRPVPPVRAGPPPGLALGDGAGRHAGVRGSELDSVLRPGDG